jgi:hypothetical protein
LTDGSQATSVAAGAGRLLVLLTEWAARKSGAGRRAGDPEAEISSPIKVSPPLTRDSATTGRALAGNRTIADRHDRQAAPLGLVAVTWLAGAGWHRAEPGFSNCQFRSRQHRTARRASTGPHNAASRQRRAISATMAARALGTRWTPLWLFAAVAPLAMVPLCRAGMVAAAALAGSGAAWTGPRPSGAGHCDHPPPWPPTIPSTRPPSNKAGGSRAWRSRLSQKFRNFIQNQIPLGPVSSCPSAWSRAG